MSAPSPRPTEAFWDFSLKVYSGDGVQAACLALQEAGLDVNVALWIVWTVVQGRDPEPALGSVVERSTVWSAAVVKPLRAARTGLKSPPDFVDHSAAAALRKIVLGAELEAERLEQLALEGLSDACPDHGPPGEAPTLTLKALKAYEERLGASAPSARFVEVVFEALEKV